MVCDRNSTGHIPVPIKESNLRKYHVLFASKFACPEAAVDDPCIGEYNGTKYNLRKALSDVDFEPPDPEGVHRYNIQICQQTNNPCMVENQLRETPICQTDSKDLSRSCGDINNFKWGPASDVFKDKYPNATVSITYQGGDDGRKTEMVLLCDVSVTGRVVGPVIEASRGSYHLLFVSKYVCPDVSDICVNEFREKTYDLRGTLSSTDYNATDDGGGGFSFLLQVCKSTNTPCIVNGVPLQTPICQLDTLNRQHSCGDIDTFKWTEVSEFARQRYPDAVFSITYENGNWDRKSEIVLLCNPQVEGRIVGVTEPAPLIYVVGFATKHVC